MIIPHSAISIHHLHATLPRMKRLGVSILGTVVGFGIGLEAQSPTPPPAFKPLVANAAPSRTCESRATVTLPNTTIESASVDQGDQTIGQSCRVTAVLTHPPAGDKVRIFLAFPINDWKDVFRALPAAGFQAEVRWPFSRNPPFPSIAHYKGQGSTDDAANFACRAE
jgi:hypothetical protein